MRRLKLTRRGVVLGLLFTAFVLYACDDTVITTGPTGGGAPPPEDPPSRPDDPPPNPGVMFSWDDTRGILVFPGTQADEMQIRTLDNRLRSSGWPTPTYHACSETDEWKSTQWADGPAPFSKENLDNLRRFLRVTAELGSQVLLDVFCTKRDNNVWMDAHGEDYATVVAEIAADYDHVAIHVANEAWHHRSWFRGSKLKLKIMRDALRLAGFRGLVGTDDNAGRPGDTRYNRDYLSLGFWVDFHPWREVNGKDSPPTRADFREMKERNNSFGRVVISEPIAYSTWLTGGCCTKSKELIKRNMRDAEVEGLVWFFHSTDGLQWPALAEHFEWIPEA